MLSLLSNRHNLPADIRKLRGSSSSTGLRGFYKEQQESFLAELGNWAQITHFSHIPSTLSVSKDHLVHKTLCKSAVFFPSVAISPQRMKIWSAEIGSRNSTKSAAEQQASLGDQYSPAGAFPELSCQGEQASICAQQTCPRRCGQRL